MKFNNIQQLFADRVSRYGSKINSYKLQDQDWIGISWDQFNEQSRHFASALISMGLTKGRSVSILMNNVPEWPFADIGTIMAGGVAVGVYPTSAPEQCQYIIHHSDSEFVLVDSALQLGKVLRVKEQLPNVKAIICLDADASKAHEDVISYHDFLKLGYENLDKTLATIEMLTSDTPSKDTAIMVYTSGTTGLPKGACLSHQYIINSVESIEKVIDLNHNDITYSYLPYCHVAERVFGFYNRLHAGTACYFVEDITKLFSVVVATKPRIFGSLPRIFEKIHARILVDVEHSNPETKELFHQVLKLGIELNRLKATGNVPEDLRAKYEQLSPPIIKMVKAYFGGKVELLNCGGAYLSTEIAEFFTALGVPLLQIYGMTESLCITYNRPDNYRLDTVGNPMLGSAVSIAEDGEIMVRNEMTFSGYYKEPEKTADVLKEGWLYTGDLGALTEEGFLKITGRKKELIITSTGKNVAPALLENMIKAHPLISQAVAYGDNKSYLVALITLNQLETEMFAKQKQIAYENFAELTQKPEILNIVKRIVDETNAKVSTTESIKNFAVLDKDFTIDADEITPTLKVKRNIVTERYKDLFEALYS